MQGEQWDGKQQEHHQRDSAEVHASGVLHVNVHKANNLATPDWRIVFLESAAAKVQAPASQVKAEMRHH